ncbi:MAG: FAD-dependent oxidoreductase [Chloroflexota bacterium]
MSKRALVIGGSMQGVQAALELADRGTEVTLVEDSPTLHANSNGDVITALPSMPKLLEAASRHNIKVITDARIEQIKGEKDSFRATIVRHPRYVKTDVCTSCGRCELECPVEIATPATDGQEHHKAIHRPAFGLKSVPSAYSIEKKGLSPCTTACPAGINVHGYIALIAHGKYTEALDLVTEAVPFPRVLGRVCTHPCESKCTRNKVDKAVAICTLKRFVADNNSTESSLRRTHNSNGVKPSGPPQAAIIGSGPAGLTAARDLARMGHRATVFEALPVAGGMIAVGMPRFRLPREVRQADIEDIIRLGIEIRTSTPVGSELTLEDLRRQGYEAILIATGAHKNQRLNIPGENLLGVINSITFLQALNLKQPVTVGSRVVVIGGGYTAIDSARTAIRLNCDRVQIIYRRSLEEMPATPEEVAEAQEEGVEIEYLAAPVRVIGEDGRVKGIECIRMRLGEPDRSGRRRPIPVEGSEFFIKADTVIVAVGQRADLSFLGENHILSQGRRHIAVDHLTMATEILGVFAAGDVAGEPGPMIDAIAAGRRAAVAIDRFLRGEELSREATGRLKPVEVNPEEVFVPQIPRQEMPRLKPEARVGNFEEVALGFTPDMAAKEAARCLNCGGCSLCLECTRACELEAIDHASAPETFDIEIDAIITATKATGVPAEADLPGIYVLPPSGNGDLSQASDLAARVADDLIKGEIPIKANVSAPPEAAPVRQVPCAEARMGVFVCGCGGSISSVVDVPRVVRHFRGLEGVSAGGQVGYACTAEGAAEIKNAVRQHRLSHVIVAACACCSLDQICFSCSDRRIQCKANLLNDGQHDGVVYEFVNIREHCAWTHGSQPEAATAKAIELIAAGAAHAGRALNITQAVAVVDGQRCRGCGTCVSVCQYEAVALEEKDGAPVAQVNAELCRWCGACVAHCPSGALSQNGYSDEQVIASLEAILAR